MCKQTLDGVYYTVGKATGLSRRATPTLGTKRIHCRSLLHEITEDHEEIRDHVVFLRAAWSASCLADETLRSGEVRAVTFLVVPCVICGPYGKRF